MHVSQHLAYRHPEGEYGRIEIRPVVVIINLHLEAYVPLAYRQYYSRKLFEAKMEILS